MKITVIVPVYNRLEHLRALCQCLIRQEVQPDELIISDDGSSEKVIDYIGDLLPEMKFKVKHIYQEDLGFRKARALNNAVRESEGEILIFCDQDLIFPENYIKNIRFELKDKKFLMSRPVSITEEEKDKVLKYLSKGEAYEKILEIIPNKYQLYVNSTLKKDRLRRILNVLKLNKRGIRLVGMSYVMYKKDYIAINGYDEKYIGWGYEDDDFGNRLYVHGVRGKEYTKGPIQLHLYHPFDPTKKHSANEQYYYRRKREIFKEKNFSCEYGYDNQLMKDKVRVSIIK